MQQLLNPSVVAVHLTATQECECSTLLFSPVLYFFPVILTLNILVDSGISEWYLIVILTCIYHLLFTLLVYLVSPV